MRLYWSISVHTTKSTDQYQGDVERTIAAGLPQTWECMDKCGVVAGHLVIFDRTPERTWGEKIFERVVEYQGTPIRVWGM